MVREEYGGFEIIASTYLGQVQVAFRPLDGGKGHLYLDAWRSEWDAIEAAEAVIDARREGRIERPVARHTTRAWSMGGEGAG